MGHHREFKDIFLGKTVKFKSKTDGLDLHNSKLFLKKYIFILLFSCDLKKIWLKTNVGRYSNIVLKV